MEILYNMYYTPMKFLLLPRKAYVVSTKLTSKIRVVNLMKDNDIVTTIRFFNSVGD